MGPRDVEAAGDLRARHRAIRVRGDRVLARLSRVTSGGTFIAEVDGLRFIAIFSVLLYHLNNYLKRYSTVSFSSPPSSATLDLLLRQGHFGVQLFFVISGFILALPFAEHYLTRKGRPALGKYFKRRLTRLEPPYIVNLLVAFVLLLGVNHLKAAELAPHLAASMTYLHNAIYKEISTINGVAWSLEVEVQFYILAPLINTVFLVREPWIRRGIVIGAGLGCAWAFRLGHWALFLPGQIQWFLAGTLLADLYLVVWKRQPARAWAWDVLGTAAWVGVVYVTTREVLVPVLLPGLILLAYIGAFRGRLWNQIISNRWLATIGGMCYTIYLYHYFVISMVGRWAVRVSLGRDYVVNYVLQVILVVPVVLLVCAVLF